MKSNIAKLVLLSFFVISIGRGCDCSKNVSRVPENWNCLLKNRRPLPTETTCQESKRFAKGQCVEERCDVGEPPAGCCPGTFCNSGGECVIKPSRYEICETDADCNSGLVCFDRPFISQDVKTCGFLPISETGDCIEGSIAFNGRCINNLDPPCDGKCPTGQVCNIDAIRREVENDKNVIKGGLCENPPALSEQNGCQQSCGKNEILVYSDPDSMLWNGCCAFSCECVPLPPLATGAWGKYVDSTLSVSQEKLYISAYNSTYGDLVMAIFNLNNLIIENMHFIDGVPTNAEVVADPQGPREGKKEHGLNVGRYTSIALYNDQPRIAYYDPENGNLKFAYYQNNNQQWIVTLVDDGRDDSGTDTGDVGRYTSLEIDPAGFAHMTYYAHRIIRDDQLLTTAMYARALKTDPTSYHDFERIPVEPIGSCNAMCHLDEHCVMLTSGPSCVPPHTGCTPECACDEVCVSILGQPQCHRFFPNSLIEPCDGDCPSGYRCVENITVSGTICLATAKCSCDSDKICIQDENGNNTCRTEVPYSDLAGLPEGVGLFTSLVLFQDHPVITYYDRLLRQLRGATATFSYNSELSDFSSNVIDCDNYEDIGQHAVLATFPAGNMLAVAYQALGGSTLWYRQAPDISTLATVDPEFVDLGIRQSRLHKVGANADLSFVMNNGQWSPIIAYADQTDNDLVLSLRSNEVWQKQTLLVDGAHGGFISISTLDTTAWISNYLRERNAYDLDSSRLTLEKVVFQE